VNEVSSDAPILSTQTNNLFPVESWLPKVHAKLGSPASMQVSYFAGNTSVGNLTAITTHSHREWVCFDHEGFARRKAESWWLKMGGSLPYPVDVKDAIARFSELTMPNEIQLKKEGKYYVITNHYFEQQPVLSVAPAASVPEIHHAAAETASDTFSANDVRPSVSSAFSRALSAV
jgi:DNA repair protein RadD